MMILWYVNKTRTKKKFDSFLVPLYFLLYFLLSFLLSFANNRVISCVITPCNDHRVDRDRRFRACIRVSREISRSYSNLERMASSSLSLFLLSNPNLFLMRCLWKARFRERKTARHLSDEEIELLHKLHFLVPSGADRAKRKSARI